MKTILCYLFIPLTISDIPHCSPKGFNQTPHTLEVRDEMVPDN